MAISNRGWWWISIIIFQTGAFGQLCVYGWDSGMSWLPLFKLMMVIGGAGSIWAVIRLSAEE